MYYIYIVRTARNTLYTGITTNVERRMKEHLEKSGKGAKYTRSNPPRSLEAVWSCESRSEALKIEAYIKKLTKLQKEKIIDDKEFCFTEFEACHRENFDIGILSDIVRNAEVKNENCN